jgi:DNA polymerase-3 subunit gamma/tau
VEITKGSSLDIIEIDGASNRGIDEIRTLRENVKLSTAHSRYKVYIIDEVHMLTQEAFNALLKTLEEPPVHVKFIFATTHPHKVLPTILSRCQKFQFSLVSLEKIVDKLKKIIKSEDLTIEDSLLYAISRAAAGSIRDAESLLDQLAPVVLDKGSLKDVFSFLGIVDEDSLVKMLTYIVAKDLNSSLAFVDSIVRSGKDLGIFLNALIEYLRNLLLVKVSPKVFKELLDVSPQAKDSLIETAQNISTTEVLNVIDEFIEAKELSHRLNTVRIPFELALVNFSYKEEPLLIDQKPSDKNSKKGKEKVKVDDDEESKQIQVKANNPNTDFELELDSLDITKEESEGIEMAGSESHDQSDNLILAEVKAKWQDVVSHIQKVRAAIASHLSLALPISSFGNKITIAFSRKNYFHKEIIETNKNLKFVEDVISKIMGRAIVVKLVLSEDVSGREMAINREKVSNMEDSSQEDLQAPGSRGEFINELLDTFGGKLHTDDE